MLDGSHRRSECFEEQDNFFFPSASLFIIPTALFLPSEDSRQLQPPIDILLHGRTLASTGQRPGGHQNRSELWSSMAIPKFQYRIDKYVDFRLRM
jgi:hypothetical protein